MKNLRLRLLSYVVMAYLLMAFAWWAMLMFTKNRDAFLAKAELMKIGMVAEGRVASNSEFEQTADFQELEAKYKRQEYMIFGEATVFVLTLLAGIWFINQGYQREVRANDQQRNFLLSITHELKSPMASIRLVLETLLKRDLPKEKTDQLLQSALRENERLNELVENLLLSAKLETAYQPHFEELDLGELLRELLAKLRARHPEASLLLTEPSGFPKVTVDRLGAISLISNLVENAVKYADDRAVVQVRLFVEGQKWGLEVADNGPGIPDREKKRIFGKFYRIGSEETRRTKGTGLGLFIVEQIVRAHKWHLRVLDNQPKGTVFQVTGQC